MTGREAIFKEGLTDLHILIIGAGAIGSLLGAKLALAEHDVMLVGRQPLVDAVRAGGLTLFEPDKEPRVVAAAAVPSVAAAFDTGKLFDLALVTVKAYDTAAVVAELQGAADARSDYHLEGDSHCGHLPPLLTIQNGVGNEETLAEAFGADCVISGALDTPASVPAPGQVRVHRTRYRVGLAPVGSGAAVTVAAGALTGAGFDVKTFPDYRGLKWTKLLMNILANASCAILDWTPAQVMADPVTSRLEARAWQEALAVMAGLGIQPVALAGYPFPLVVPIARRLPAGWLARGLRGFVSGGRGSKMPSLQIALSRGKRSEVGWLNGAVAHYGRQLGLPVPINIALTELLTALTEGQADWSEYRDQPSRLITLVESQSIKKLGF